MLGFYNYTVILTYAGMLTAFSGIVATCNGRERMSLICLVIAGLCDMFDGAVARTRERTPAEKRFGIQIDSLSDLISFGVLPGMILYCGNQDIWSIIIASFYVLCALIRLAFFNVMEEERQEQTNESRTYYLGLPVTSSAIILPVAYALQAYSGGSGGMTGRLSLLVTSILFLLPVKVRKPQSLGKTCLAILGVAGFLLLAGE